jgi:hypothetical protein
VEIEAFREPQDSLDFSAFLGRRIKKMRAWTYSLIAGFIMGPSTVWAASLINDRYLRREKDLSRLILKRAKKG